jgi:hypothetical protein
MHGTLGTTEVWNTTINWGIFGILPDDPNQALTDGLLAALLTATTSATYPVDFKTALSTAGKFTGYRVDLMSEADKVLSTSVGDMATPITGTGSPSKTSADCIVISLRTPKPGPSGRGRWYFPALAQTLNYGNFTTNSPTADNMALAARTWLNAMGTAMNGYWIGLASALRVVLSVRSVKLHQNNNVVRIQVGSVMDTQRRRRDNIPETYVTYTYPS